MFSLIDQFYNTTVRFEADKKLPEYNDNYISLGIVEYYFTQEEYDKLKQIFENINLDKINNDIYKKHISKRIIQAEIFAQNFDVARVLIQKYQNDYGNDYDLKYISLQLAYLTENSTEGFELNTDLLNNWKYEKYNSTLGFSLDDLLVLGGNLFLSTKENYFDALDVYELALKENPENAEACYGAAIAYYDLGFPEQALKMIDWAIKLRQDWDEAIAFKNIINGK
jgi:tetratricopeptide (TPR) repeat protein